MGGLWGAVAKMHLCVKPLAAGSLARFAFCSLACSLACVLACLLACLHACLPACLPSCLLARLPAYLLACLLACARAWLSMCLRACFRGCMAGLLLCCLLACLPRSLAEWLFACLAAWTRAVPGLRGPWWAEPAMSKTGKLLGQFLTPCLAKGGPHKRQTSPSRGEHGGGKRSRSPASISERN